MNFWFLFSNDSKFLYICSVIVKSRPVRRGGTVQQCGLDGRRPCLAKQTQMTQHKMADWYPRIPMHDYQLKTIDQPANTGNMKSRWQFCGGSVCWRMVRLTDISVHSRTVKNTPSKSDTVSHEICSVTVTQYPRYIILCPWCWIDTYWSSPFTVLII